MPILQYLSCDPGPWNVQDGPLADLDLFHIELRYVKYVLDDYDLF